MDDRTRTVLMAIDRHLAVGDRAASELWDVLTALRGPDSGDEKKKGQTTIHVRATAFPATVTAGRFPGMTRIGELKSPVRDGLDHHFSSHIRAAADVLGMA